MQDNKNKEIEEIRQDIRAILTNHLPHIQIELAENKQALKLIFWLLAVIGSAIIVNLIGTFF